MNLTEFLYNFVFFLENKPLFLQVLVVDTIIQGIQGQI